MKYEYKLLKMDGTVELLETLNTAMDYNRIKEVLSCQMIEIIPQSYYLGDVTDVTCIGDEEGRFYSKNTRNPHFKVLRDADNNPWDVVGNILIEVKTNGGK